MHHHGNQQMGYGNEDPNIDYDDSHHLLSGLQNMISEADYQAGNVSTSNFYTTDQLDSYWSRQSASEIASYPEQSSPPVHSSRLPLLSPAFVQESQTTSPNVQVLRHDSFAPMPIPSNEELPGFVSTQMVQRDDVASFGSGFLNDPAMRTSPLSLPMKEEFSKDSLFHASHYNNIWNHQATETPIASALDNADSPKVQHSRANSRGSWGLPQFMHRSPAHSKTDSKSEDGVENSESKDKSSPHSNGRRLSRLISKSGMNHLFKSPTHEKPWKTKKNMHA